MSTNRKRTYNINFEPNELPERKRRTVDVPPVDKPVPRNIREEMADDPNVIQVFIDSRSDREAQIYSYLDGINDANSRFDPQNPNRNIVVHYFLNNDTSPHAIYKQADNQFSLKSSFRNFAQVPINDIVVLTGTPVSITDYSKELASIGPGELVCQNPQRAVRIPFFKIFNTGFFSSAAEPKLRVRNGDTTTIAKIKPAEAETYQLEVKTENSKAIDKARNTKKAAKIMLSGFAPYFSKIEANTNTNTNAEWNQDDENYIYFYHLVNDRMKNLGTYHKAENQLSIFNIDETDVIPKKIFQGADGVYFYYADNTTTYAEFERKDENDQYDLNGTLTIEPEVSQEVIDQLKSLFPNARVVIKVVAPPTPPPTPPSSPLQPPIPPPIARPDPRIEKRLRIIGNDRIQYNKQKTFRNAEEDPEIQRIHTNQMRFYQEDINARRHSIQRIRSESSSSSSNATRPGSGSQGTS